jgi:hypothetical protein
MPVDQTILNEVIKLQALHAEGLERATTLREILEGELQASPKTLRRKEIVAAAVNDRNIRIRKKQME